MHHSPARRRIIALSAAFAATAVLPARLLAQEPAILQVSGRVAASKAYSRTDLASLGITRLITSTPWTDGPRLFEGVLARNVMAAAGASDATTVTASALNNYSIDIPVSDFFDYDVILAWSMDGVPLSRRDKGPLWIVYPRDDVPELADPLYEHRWVWQLERLLLP